MVKVETHDCRSFVACFWNTGNKEWEGIVSNKLENMNVSIIKSDHAIILLRKSDSIESVSNEYNH